jgi:hypothetical protein
MTVCSEAPRAISTPEQIDTRLGTLELIVPAASSETVEPVGGHVDLPGSNVFLIGYARTSATSVKWRPRKGLLRYSDCTELLPGLPRTPSDTKLGATSTPTGQPAGGEGI